MRCEYVRNENIDNVLKSRYLHHTEDGKSIETPEDMLTRVAKLMASVESHSDMSVWEELFYNAMASKEFMPNSPTLMNAGRKLNQLSACFVIPIEDSIQGIMKAATETALVQKSGGGTGFTLDRLRPTGDYIHSSGGTTSGPISFWRILHQTTCSIQQGSWRRGASMMQLSLHHPDILKFINIKQDLTQFTSFNISVKVTDAEMASILNHPELPLQVVNPRTQIKYVIPRTIDGSKLLTYELKELLPADKFSGEKVWTYGEVWKMICHNAWNTGEPGICFIDLVQRTNTVNHRVQIETSNPCVPAGTRILTRDGYKPIERRQDIPTEIWNGEAWVFVTPKVTGTNQPLIKVTLSDGSSLVCTEAHKWILADQTRISAIDLVPGDILTKCEMPVVDNKDTFTKYHAYSHGFYCGDGQDADIKAGVLLYGGKQSLVSYLKGHTTGNILKGDRVWFKFEGDMPPKTHVPFGVCIQDRLDWLAGLLDSDGNVMSNPNSTALCINNNNTTLLNETRLLLTTLGCAAKVTPNKKAGFQEMPDGHGGSKKYWCQDQYRLLINATDTLTLLNLGLKTHRLVIDKFTPQRDARRFVEVVKTEPAGIADTVYCFTEPEKHAGVFEGILTGQCGEQFLPAHGACSLGSINLAAFVNDDKTINYPGLKKITQLATRFLDNSISVNNFPVPEIKEQALNDRRIGIGIMGFADALYKMRVRYNSPEGYALAEQIMSFINTEAHNYSEQLAKERGSFPWWAGSYWEKQNKPMRNCMLTNVAPTGTISILADCSGGLEPLFSLGFWRQVLNGQVMWQGNKYFDAALAEAGIPDSDKQLIYDYVAGKPGSKQEGSGTLFGCPVKLPDWIKTVFVTARDIPVHEHITMQAAFQKHVDNAVSKTVNLPENAKQEEVDDAFRFAYKNGCKGITVYRDKCRSNQPMSLSVHADKKPVLFKPTKKKLPRVSKLVGYKFTEPLGDIYVNIRHDAERNICEMFANTERANTVVSLYVNALSRILSTAIRYGVPAEAFEFLEKMHDPEEQPPIIGPFGVTTGPEAFGRALKFFRMGLLDDQAVIKHHKDTYGELEKLRQELNKLPENYKQTTGTLCPDCSALMYPNPGCSNGMLCYSCGHTTGHCKG